MDQKRCVPLTAENWKDLLASTDAVFFDCDGTLWRGQDILPGAISLMNRLLGMGKRVGYATNNSVRTHAEMVSELQRRGFPTKELSLVMCTAQAVAVHLAEKIPNGTAFVLADSGLAPELDKVNIRSFTDEVFDGNFDKLEADAVVCGLDKAFSYRRLTIATHLLRKRKNAIFVATNMDTTFPEAGDRVSPDCGSLAASLIASSGRPLDACVGKPGPIMFQQLSKHGVNIDPKRVLMVGDRCETDIGFASSIGGRSILVLTGISNVDEAKSYCSNPNGDSFGFAPHFIAPSVEVLDNLFPEIA